MPPSNPKPWLPSSPAFEPDQFEDLIAGSPVIIHFWAPWNTYDKDLDANLQKTAPALKNKFAFFSLNTDNTLFNPIVENHHVGVLPTLLCFANGRLRGRFHGLQTPEALTQFLTEMSTPLPR